MALRAIGKTSICFPDNDLSCQSLLGFCLKRESKQKIKRTRTVSWVELADDVNKLSAIRADFWKPLERCKKKNCS